jgi:DNA replication ATP-dependent helicase Dna2
MPLVTKNALSQFIRTECKRQLRLNLSPPDQDHRDERAAAGMPPPQPPRPGLEQFTQAGEEWEALKLNDLNKTFGSTVILGKPVPQPNGLVRYAETPLDELVSRAVPHVFLAEAQFTIEPGSVFERALGIEALRQSLGVAYAALRPDLLQVLPPARFARIVRASGDLGPVADGDTRLQLRVIDIKLTAEPTPSYFAEVAYYTMALAGWLEDRGLADRFVVVPEGAVWPGSHDASKLTAEHRRLMAAGGRADVHDLLAALEGDLELIPFEVFAYRVRRFFQVDVSAVLAPGRSWRDLEWHVDNRCKNCEYLGYPWVNAAGESTAKTDHCMPTAEREDHLCQVAFVSRGASAALQVHQVRDVAGLAELPVTHEAFNAHHTLRATRTVVAGRAAALRVRQSAIPDRSGTSAVMPRWADLRIHVSVDFDIGSAITVAFGIKAFWLEPYGASPRRYARWGANGARVETVGEAPEPAGAEERGRFGPRVFVVNKRRPEKEREELLAFLRHLHTILTDAQQFDPNTTVQLYLWDSLQFDHLTRVVGRHLQAILQDQSIQYLAWLFPAPELLRDPDLASRRSPITIVRDVVRAVLAAPVPHYYGLLAIGRVYHRAGLPEGMARFWVHPLFEDALSDQIPSERAHEIWSDSTTPGRHWQDQLRQFERTVETRLNCLEAVQRRLEDDLRPTLSNNAPAAADLGLPQRAAGLSFHGHLWYTFALLNEALENLEVHRIRAMPPHEREARFRSARLNRRLTGDEERDALEVLGLLPRAGRRVYAMRPTSSEVKFKEGEFNCALAPELVPGFLDASFRYLTRGTQLEPFAGADMKARMEAKTRVTVAGIDRDRLLLAVDVSDRRWSAVFDDLERHNIAVFDRNVVLDPTHGDYLTGALYDVLHAVGNPPAAVAAGQADPRLRQTTGQLRGRRPRQTPHTPPADVFWGARQMYDTPVMRDLEPVRRLLLGTPYGLNDTQWKVWGEALTRRLQLIWGPPGTGKTQTARAVILGAVLDGHRRNVPLRVLVCANTYNAMDLVLLRVRAAVEAVAPGICQVARIRSSRRTPDDNVPARIDYVLTTSNPTQAVLDLKTRLSNREGLTIVGALPKQVYNLVSCAGGGHLAELFDFILIDEASQMDVAHFSLALSAMAAGAALVLAGDPLQLPPIHKADAPLGYEALVGSAYAFCRDHHGVPDAMLALNYRSNETLVEFSREAGYRRELTSVYQNLRLQFTDPLPAARPADWPAHLFWAPDWARLLDLTKPAVCFVYPEGRSSQWNHFEADAVASLVWLLSRRLADRLMNDTGPQPDDWTFWGHGVGVVTPHRAQQGLIVSRLQSLFPDTPPATIRDAVDTVERFQGQQRDVIIASFALGDADAIGQEEEFLMSLNRFNVMASRARAKLVVLVSREVVDHLAGDLDVLRGSRLLKVYAESYCNLAEDMSLGVVENGVVRQVAGQFRYRN